MTVHELIEQLQGCDKPDAEVRMGAQWRNANGEWCSGATVAANEVSYDEVQGPVFIYGVSSSEEAK